MTNIKFIGIELQKEIEDINIFKLQSHFNIEGSEKTDGVHNYILNRAPPEIDKSETELPRQTPRLQAQLHANKSPLLSSYLHNIDPT